MADDLTDRAPEDRSRVNVNEAWELRRWCRQQSPAMRALRGES